MIKKECTLNIRVGKRMEHDLEILEKQIGLTKADIMRIALFNFIKENLEKPEDR